MALLLSPHVYLDVYKEYMCGLLAVYVSYRFATSKILNGPQNYIGLENISLEKLGSEKSKTTKFNIILKRTVKKDQEFWWNGGDLTRCIGLLAFSISSLLSNVPLDTGSKLNVHKTF